jgi:histone H2A
MSKTQTYARYIHKVGKQINGSDFSVSKKTMNIMDQFAKDMLGRIAKEAGRLTQYNKKKTISSRELQIAVQLVIGGELAKHAVSEGQKAVATFSSNPRVKGETKSRSSRAGLHFPVGRIHRTLKYMRVAERVGQSAPVFLAAVIEYLTAELIEATAKVTKDKKRTRMSTRHLMIGVNNDEEFAKLLRNTQISGAGVMPGIEKSLLPKKRVKKNSV